MPIRKLTIFMFGYDGWGNSTELLHKATAAVERQRGYRRPYWVDTRFSPYTLAAGFYGRTFASVVGDDHYCSMPELGNANVGSNPTSDRIRIETPQAAERLLDLALQCWRRRQRVIYFCQCPEPRHCHRRKIAILLIRAAKKRRVALQVVEWPGGEPQVRRISVRIPSSAVRKSHLALDRTPRPLAVLAGLAAGSRLRVYDGQGWEDTFAVKAARYTRGSWQFPLVKYRGRPAKKPADVAAWRDSHAYSPMVSPAWRRH